MSARDVASKHNTTRGSLYKRKRQLLNKEPAVIVDKKLKNQQQSIKKATTTKEEILQPKQQRDDLSLQLTKLQKEVHRLKIEKDIYEKAAEIF